MMPVEMDDAVEAVVGPRIVVGAWTTFDRGHMLVVRPFGVDVWFLAGGLVEPGESLQEAASREAREEVGVRIDPVQMKPYTVATAPAHGRPGVTAVLAVHVGRYSGVPRALDEIEDVEWITALDRGRCAPAVAHVVDDAVARGDLGPE